MANHHPVDPDKDRCPRCMKPYDFWTKDGRLVGPFHPIGECEPRRDPPDRRYCEVCDEIIAMSRPGPKKKTCSPKCKQEMDRRIKLARQIVSANKSRLQREAALKQRKEA